MHTRRSLLHAGRAALAGAALLHGSPLLAAAGDTAFADKLLQLGTGPTGGAFRPIGTAVCDAVNEERRRTQVRCVPVGTAGSTFNLQAVIDGQLELGLAQEDLVAAYARRSDEGALLRVVAVMHTSPIAVMAHDQAGLETLEQLAGKAFNLGNRGSGQFTITASILRALGLAESRLKAVSYHPTSEFEKRFCGREVDVVVEAVAHPAEVFRRLATCGGRLLPLPPAVRQRMQRDNPFLQALRITAGTYPGQDADVPTLGMRNLLVTSASVSEEAVYRCTRSLARRLAQARAAEPMLGSVVPLAEGGRSPLPVPLHDGARRALGELAEGA